MIRFILVILTAFLYLILSIPVLLVLLLIRKKKPEVCDKVSRSADPLDFSRNSVFFRHEDHGGRSGKYSEGPGCSIHRQSPQLFRYPCNLHNGSGFLRIRREKGAGAHSALKELDGTHPLPVSRPFRHQAGSADDPLPDVRRSRAALPSVSSRRVPAARRRASWSSASSTTVHSRWQRKPAARSFRFPSPVPEKFWKHTSRRSAVPTLP